MRPLHRRNRLPLRLPLISNASWRRARGCTPSRDISTACSTRCPARAPTAVISPVLRLRRKPALNSSPQRSRLLRTTSWTGMGNWRTSPRNSSRHARVNGKMILGVPLSELLWLALAVVVGGVITGLLAGLFGIGGGAVIVPVLYEVFRILEVPDAVRMQLCVGTSLAIIVPTTIQSYLTHRAKGLVVPGVLRLWALPAVLGIVCGAAIAYFAPAAVFKIAFVVIATFIATKFMFAGDRWNLGTDLPGPVPMRLFGFVIGLTSSLMGVSGGSLSNIALTLYGKSIHQAVATSAGLGVPITIVGTLGYILAGLHDRALLPPFSLGFVSLIGVVIMAPVSSFAAPYGARLAHRLSRRTLEIAFSIFLLLISARFLVSIFYG